MDADLMKLKALEKQILQFLFDHSKELAGFDADTLVVTWRSNNPYATTLYFAHNEDEENFDTLSRLDTGGEYYLKHPEKDEFVEVMVALVNNVSESAEIVPLGLDALPLDLADFVFVKST